MRKKNKLFVIIIVVGVIAISIMVLFLNKEKKKTDYEQSIQEFQEFRKEYEAETILARNATVIFGYNGEYDRDYIYKDMKKFSDYMYYLKDQVTSKNCSKFFNKNSEDIITYLGIETEEDFKTFVEKLEKLDISEDIFKYAAYVPGSTTDENGYFSFKISFFYGENEEEVTFRVYFAKSKKTDIDVKYEFAS